jgi:hypothetical protein
MNWKQELDALIESTMAFARDVKRPRHSNRLAVRARRNPKACRQFQSASGKNRKGSRGLLFASESQDAGAR